MWVDCTVIPLKTSNSLVNLYCI